MAGLPIPLAIAIWLVAAMWIVGLMAYYFGFSGDLVWFVPIGIALVTLRAEIDHAVLAPVYEAITRVRQDLPLVVTLPGFCGAPLTLATYMIAGRRTPDQSPGATRGPNGRAPGRSLTLT